MAIPLPADVREQAAAVQGQAREACRDVDVRWVAPASLHVTLKFLGTVGAERLGELSRALQTATAQHRIPRISLGGVGVFPSPRHARALWLGVTEGAAALGELADAIERALGPLGFDAETRPFMPHLTLGRVRSPRRGADLRGALDPLARLAAGSWSPRVTVLYESHLRPTGAAYEVRAECPLG